MNMMHLISLSRVSRRLIGWRQACEADAFPGREEARHGKLPELASRQGPDTILILRGPVLFGASNRALYVLLHGGLLL
ncbi:MAG: hypothetical protein DYH03_06795 [Nitrospira sp. NTP1]|nr:hypothetical protein [Nitrospira sp. NTP1]